MALPNNNITAATVKAELGASTNSVGELCTYRNINMWSKSKPVRDPRVAIPLNEVGKGSDNRYGLNIPSYVSGSNQVTTYNRPRGTGGQYSEPYRLDDFRGYHHGESTPPVTIGPKPDKIETASLGIEGSGVIYLQSMIGYGTPLIGLHDLGLRVCAMFYVFGTEALVGWASASDDAYGHGVSYIVYRLSSTPIALNIKFSLVEDYHPWTTDAIPTNLPMWEIPRQFSNQNGDWIGVPLV